MANITENTQNPAWSNGIYQIETSDPVLGGANGIANRQAKELAARTQWLKTELAKAISSIGKNKSSTDSAIALKANHATQITAGAGLTGGGNLSANRTIGLATPSTLSGSTTNWVGNGATGHTHEIAKATPTVAGVVKLVNALNSTATDAALSAAQGKALAEQIAAAILGSLNMRGALGSNVNLNDLNDVANYGVWYNSANANAATERNYPINRAGTLLVLPSAYKGQQIYFPFDDKGIWIRDTRNNNNSPTWGGWYKISSDDRVAKSGDTMTGLLSINTGNAWARMQFGTNDGNWKMEFDPKGAASRQMNFNFNDTTGERTFIRFPALEKGVNQVVAYQSWVNEQNPKNRSGIDLDTAITPQFFINAQSANPLPVGGDWAGLVIGYNYDCTQIIAAGGNMWVRGSDANPISKPEDWSEWKRILDESNGVMLSGNQTIAGTKTFSGSLTTQSNVLFSHSSKEVFGRLGMGAADVYLHNPTSNKYLQMKDDGTLAYSNDKVILQSDFAHSRASNGYQKLPSGLILQWGSVSIKNDSYIATTFPIAFPNTCFNVQTTIDIPRAMRGGDVVSAHVGDISRTGCSIGFSENSYGGERPLYWFAIGY